MTDKTQPEALRLADALERPGYGWHSTPAQCATELRRQHTRIAELEAQLESIAASAGSEPVATVFTMEALAPGGGVKYHATVHKPLPAGTKLYTHPSPPEGMVGGWISVDERLPDLYKRVLVITTDADDEPYATPAHYNGPGKFLAAGGHRLNPVTHWQEIDAPPVGWKLPPAKPRVSHRRKPSPPTTSAGSGKGE